MKKISYLLLAIILLSSCSQDVLNKDIGKDIKEVTAHFSVTTLPMKQVTLGKTNKSINTRSTVANTVDDTRLTDLWVVQFDNNGNFMKKEYCTRFIGGTFDAPLAANYAGTTSNIYFLANIGPSYDTPDNEAAFKTFTKNFTLESDLLITDVNNSNLKSVPMFGKLTGVTVLPSGYMESFSVTLTHMLAKITFNYTIPSTTNFGLEGIQLRNVAAGLQYYPPTSPTVVTSYAVRDLAIEATTASTGTLVYYLPENQRGVGTNTDVAQNERLKDGTGNNDVKFGTYVEFSGHVIGARGGDKMTCRYYFGGDDFNDYNLVRNQNYSITTSIDGNSASDRRVTIPERTNCYWVLRSTTFEIPVTRANDSDLGLQIPDTRANWTASILWSQTASAAITLDNTTKAKGYFKVTTGSADGNALVVVKSDDTGEILWSWHIWVDDEATTTTTFSADGRYIWMDRNLGATYQGNTGSDYIYTAGLYYQWGRKDPFTGTSSMADPAGSYHTTYNAAGTAYNGSTVKITYPFTVSDIANDNMTKQTYITNTALAPLNGLANSLKLATRYPNLMLSGWRGSTAKDLSSTTTGYDSWGGGKNQAKTVYDPCPIGWRVPSGNKVNASSWYSPWNFNGFNSYVSSSRASGNYMSQAVGNTMLLAAAGYRHSNGHIYSAGVVGYYWFATSNSASAAYDGYFDTTQCIRDQTCTKDFGNTVRCVKDN